MILGSFLQLLSGREEFSWATLLYSRIKAADGFQWKKKRVPNEDILNKFSLAYLVLLTNEKLFPVLFKCETYLRPPACLPRTFTLKPVLFIWTVETRLFPLHPGLTRRSLALMWICLTMLFFLEPTLLPSSV